MVSSPPTVGRTEVVRLGRFAQAHGWTVHVLLEPYRSQQLVRNRVERLRGERGGEEFEYVDRMVGDLEEYRVRSHLYGGWKRVDRLAFLGHLVERDLLGISTDRLDAPVKDLP